MSTRATIACKQEDGRYAAIYLHFDGYHDHAAESSKNITLRSIRHERWSLAATFVRLLTTERPNDSPTATARLSCPLAQPCMNSLGTAERSTSMSLKTRLGIVISFDRLLRF